MGTGNNYCLLWLESSGAGLDMQTCGWIGLRVRAAIGMGFCVLGSYRSYASKATTSLVSFYLRRTRVPRSLSQREVTGFCHATPTIERQIRERSSGGLLYVQIEPE